VCRDVLAEVLAEAWGLSLYPNDALPEDKWREMFHATGFISDGAKATLFQPRIRLYRQAPYQYRYNWSWSSSVIFAHYATFGGRQPRRAWDPLGGLNLWRVDAPAHALLVHAHYPKTDTDDAWDEWVVDTTGLTVYPVPDYEAEERRFLARSPVRMEHKQ
jgi:hypothetical protein